MSRRATPGPPVFPEGQEIPSPGDPLSLPGGAHDTWPRVGDADGCETEPFWLVSSVG